MCKHPYSRCNCEGKALPPIVEKETMEPIVIKHDEPPEIEKKELKPEVIVDSKEPII
jgi:hypothetical protein